MSLNQVPSELLEEIAEFSNEPIMKLVSKEMREAFLAPRVIDNRKLYMQDSYPSWQSDTCVSDTMGEIGSKGTVLDMEYYIANSKGLLEYLNQFIPWNVIAKNAIEHNNLVLLLWIVDSGKLRDYSNEVEDMNLGCSSLESHPLFDVWSYLAEEGNEEAMKILAQQSMSDDTMDSIKEEFSSNIPSSILDTINVIIEE